MARKKKKVNTSNTKNLNHEIKGIIFITIGLLLIFGIYYSNAGFVGRVSKTLVFSLLGLLGYILPMLLIAYGIYIIAAQGKITSKKRLYGILIFLINTLLFIQMLTFEEYYQPESLMNSLKGIIYSQSRFHGGILGFLVDLPFYKLFGVVGSFIIFSALYVISTIVLFDISIYDMGESVRSKAKESRKKIKSNVSKDELPEKAITKELEPINPEEKSEYIKGINNKIKILDFMKNNSIVEEEKSDIVINDTPEDLNKKVSSPPTDKNINEEVNKEISEKIINMPEDVKYEFPPLDLLNINSNTKMNKEDKKELLTNANKLEETLNSFGVEAKIIQVTKGPSVTRFELQPSPGVKVSKIVNLADDIALSLAARGVRIEAPIPGKSAVGIEVPNRELSAVFLREVLESKEYTSIMVSLIF